MEKANAWYLASNCAGSLTGPVVMGLVVERWGWRGLFTGGAVAVTLVVLGATAWEWLKGPKYGTGGLHDGEDTAQPPRAA
jgi:MFS family permease